jgi:hypothetical protein
MTKHLLSASLIVVLFGAGCAAPLPPEGPPPNVPSTSPSPAAVAPREGFGKLPALQSAVAMDALSARPVAAPMGMSVGHMEAGSESGVAVATAPMAVPISANASAAPSVAPVPVKDLKIRAIPPPEPVQRQVTVEYLLEASLPPWQAEDQVLHVMPVRPDASLAANVGSSLGLPGALTSQIKGLTSFNVSWQDAAQFSWNADVTNRSVSAWKMSNQAYPSSGAKPSLDAALVMASAKSFLEAHGFSTIAATEAKIQDQERVTAMMSGSGTAGSAMPCPYAADMKAEPAVSSDAKLSIMPYPCGWWPQQVTVEYPWTEAGRRMTDAYGNPQSKAYVTIALGSNEVQGANVQLDESFERSTYALIDAETAKRRLASGGRNPLYGWGTKNIVVRLKTAELVWMRYDNWVNGQRDVYVLPGLAVSGTVDRGEKQDWTEEYRTVIPLVKDESFLPEAPSGGGAVMPMMDGAATPPMAPMMK